MNKTYFTRCAAAAVMALATAGALTAQDRPDDIRYSDAPGEEVLPKGEIQGTSKPYEERKLQFSSPGLVAKVNVKVGDPIEAGQLLAQQDVSVEEAEKKPLEIKATSTVQEEYAKADQGVNEQKHKRIEQLYKNRNATIFELEEARLAVERSKASVKLAAQERDEAKAQMAALDARIHLKTLKAPVSGYVQTLETGVGEVGGIDQQRYAMVVVQNDPLKVTVNVPVREARQLKVGQSLQVRYLDDDDTSAWQAAKVLVMKPVVEPGSQTRELELELNNDAKRPAGLSVAVKLPDGVAAAAR